LVAFRFFQRALFLHRWFLFWASFGRWGKIGNIHKRLRGFSEDRFDTIHTSTGWWGILIHMIHTIHNDIIDGDEVR
jgi:hypothetical protein